MANSFDSNFTRMLIRIFLEKFETNRVLTKSVNTQLLSGKFSPRSGDKVDFKRPTDYITRRSADGDISAGAPGSDIVTGKATGTVQPYFTVDVDFSEADQSIKMDQIEELLAPAATRIVTDFELDFAQFMVANTALSFGTYGTAVSTWSHVADTGAFMKSMGVPQDDMWNYVLNPFVQTKLADQIRSMGSGGVAGGPIKTALEKAVLTDDFAGFRVMDATTLATVSIAAVSDRIGAINGTPASTYLAAKDTMTVTINVDGLTDGQIYKAGETISVSTPPSRLNLSTRKIALDAAGAPIPWIGTLTKDTVAVATNAVDIEVTGPPIFESGGQYNTVDSVLADGDVITFRGAQGAVIQPNMFFHKQAFSVGSVPLKKLFATDTIGTTEDGMQIRVSRFSEGLKNKQVVRFDLRPAYAVLNPFFAGQGFGS